MRTHTSLHTCFLSSLVNAKARPALAALLLPPAIIASAAPPALCASGAAATLALTFAPAAAADTRSPATRGTLHGYTSGAAGFETNSYWYDTGKEVVVFDAQFTPQLAEALLTEIKSKTRSKVRYLVITHPNPDKFNGGEVFRSAGAKVVASAATARDIPAVHDYKKYFFTKIAKMFTEAEYPRPPRVDITFEKTLELPLESGSVRLSVLSHRGVSSTQTVAHIPELEALIVGDLVHHQTHAWLEGAIEQGKPVPAIGEWLKALEELRAYPKATVYGGRGGPARVAEAVSQQADYLKRMDRLVSDYVQGLGARKIELSGERAGDHYKRLAGRAAAAFPGYAHPFMIEYGVYGLAQAKAAQKK